MKLLSSLILGGSAALRIVHCNNSTSFKSTKELQNRRTDSYEICCSRV